MEFADRFREARLELLLKGLPLCHEMRETCQALFAQLQSNRRSVAEEACLDLHRLAAETLAIALCLEQVATLAEAHSGGCVPWSGVNSGAL